MKSVQATAVLALAAKAMGHGYIYSVTADNTVYPGWDVYLDVNMKPTPERIEYGTPSGATGPVTDTEDPHMACNVGLKPIPQMMGTIRAGGSITFAWSHWLISHKGPISAWMAPYEGEIADVNVNELEFFKIKEDIRDEDGRWANVKMMEDTNGTWTAQIPADIKPGKYVIRQELIALHFALATNPGFEFAGIGPQFYPHCFNFEVTGSGTATPEGHTFPGAYRIDEPGFHFDVNSTDPFPAVGPPVYVSSYEVDLEPLDHNILSPTGDPDLDTKYWANQAKALQSQGQLTSYLDSIGG